MADLWKRTQFGPVEQEIEILRGAERKTLKVSWAKK
jgi:hypothetical protein